MTQDQEDLRYAGFWIRFAAEIIDSIVLMIASMILPLLYFGVVFWVRVLQGGLSETRTGFTDIVLGQTFQVISVVCYFIASYVYFVWGQYRYGTTLGKRLLHIFVVDARTLKFMTLGQAHLRLVGYFTSSIIFSIGYVMAAFHPQKRALHDILAKTYSIIDQNGQTRGHA